MLAKILPTGLARKAYQQMKEMKGRDLLYIMSEERFIYFLNQLGNIQKSYQSGIPGNGSNVQYEVRIQITGTNEVGLSSSPENYMPDYLEAASKMLKHEQYTLEFMPLTQRHMLPNVLKDWNFPSKEKLKEYIVEIYSSADGTTQWF